MKEIEEKELYLINGGGYALTATIINAVVSATKIVLEIGRSLGSSLRRTSGKSCSI